MLAVENFVNVGPWASMAIAGLETNKGKKGIEGQRVGVIYDSKTKCFRY